MTKFLTTARLWVALRLSLALHFASEFLRPVGTKVLAGLRWLVLKSYAFYLLVCSLIVPLFALVCLVQALLDAAHETIEFVQRNVYTHKTWHREVQKLKPPVTTPASSVPSGGHSGVNPLKQPR